jgi:hypothetical protein
LMASLFQRVKNSDSGRGAHRDVRGLKCVSA